MEAMKCDRCGKYIDGGDIPAIRGWRSANARRGDMPTLKMDLCDACYKALEDFLENGNEKKDRCIDCENFNCKEYYADNTTEVSPIAWGSCTKCQRNFVTIDPYNQVPSWCPLKGDEDESNEHILR